MPYIDNYDEWKRKRVAREYQAFADTPIDSVHFTVGRWRYAVSALYLMTGLTAVFFGKQLFIYGVRAMTAGTRTGCILLVVLSGISLLATFCQLFRRKLRISATGFTYRGELYSYSDIQKLEITAGNRIRIYVSGEKLCTYAWDESNAEKLIAWARKCEVRIEDERVGISAYRVQPAAKPAASQAAAPKTAEPPVPEPLVIKQGEYQECADLTEFTVPEGVSEIGCSAFRDCVNLERIKLPDSLTKIGGQAFSGCLSLREIRLPAGLKSLGNHAFSECRALEHIRIPDGMRGTELPGGLFYNCTSLETVVLPDRLSGRFENIFSHCECLREIRLPEGIVSIGSFSFQYCGLLETIRIPATVKKIEYKAFAYCTGLREMYIPDSVRIIDAYRTFAECCLLEKIRLPRDVTFRHVFPEDDGYDAVDCCFKGCTSLRTVILGNQEFTLDGPFNEAALARMRGTDTLTSGL